MLFIYYFVLVTINKLKWTLVLPLDNLNHPEMDHGMLIGASLSPLHVKLCFYCVTCVLHLPEPLWVLIEYVPYGDLLGYLRKSRGLNDTYYKDPDIKPQTTLTSQQLIKFAWQIADGMSYLSSRSVCKDILFDCIV